MRTEDSVISCDASFARIHDGSLEGRPGNLSHRAFSVRRVVSDEELEQVDELVARKYAWRGYQVAKRGTDVATFAAWDNSASDAPVGTLTLRMGLRQELECEKTFPEEIAPYRARGERICEVCCLAIEDEEHGLQIFAGLFHVAYLHAIVLGATRLFSEVNPRHAPVYRRALGFSQIGTERLCPRANAPAVLVTAGSAFITAQIGRHAGNRRGAGANRLSSIYSHFFSGDEVGSVARQLLHMEGPASRAGGAL